MHAVVNSMISVLACSTREAHQDYTHVIRSSVIHAPAAYQIFLDLSWQSLSVHRILSVSGHPPAGGTGSKPSTLYYGLP